MSLIIDVCGECVGNASHRIIWKSDSIAGPFSVDVLEQEVSVIDTSNSCH